MPHIIIGTAGHIDHGKSALVKALTGTDPDRLAEEQERGMTIDLGFAFLNENIAIIDVPGHEKFIKNMVAGASTIDLALLVVAADDGVMPQTREHLEILSLLNVRRGLVAVTKVDLVDDDLLELVFDDVAELTRGSFLENAPLLPVSSVDGRGIEELKEKIVAMAAETESRPDRGIFWMPVDRSFTIKGFGTVVTGSVLSGQVRAGDSLEILPQKRAVRVRGIQAHGKPVEAVRLGDRAAINLAGSAKEDVARGDVLATADAVEPTLLLDIKLQLLKSAPKTLANRTRVRLHLGTREIMARIKLLDVEILQPGEACLAQLYLEQPTVALRREPFVIRRYSPALTIGGGVILDNHPARHKRFNGKVVDFLRRIENHDPAEVVDSLLLQSEGAAIGEKEISQKTGLTPEQLGDLLKQLEAEKRVVNIGSPARAQYVHAVHYNSMRHKITDYLTVLHKKEPLKLGVSKAELKTHVAHRQGSQKLFEAILLALIQEGVIEEQSQWIKLSSHSIELSVADRRLADGILKILLKEEFSPPSADLVGTETEASAAEVKRVLGALQGLGEVIRLEGDLYFSSKTIEKAKALLGDYLQSHEEITVSQFRELLNTTRKYALGILAYFDQLGITERVGDTRTGKRMTDA
jgi:selenocysteine-specific elongation factor